MAAEEKNICRPTKAIINLEALRHNLRPIRKLLKPEADILAVVKADAYGHGAVRVAQTCVEAGAAMLGVAMVDEGVHLRRAGFKIPILVQCCAGLGEIECALKNALTLTVPSLGFGREVSVAAGRLRQKASVHVDIDTGMGRIGFTPKGAADEIVALSGLPGLTIDGIYTHFSTSEIEEDTWTLGQLELFKTIVEELSLRGIRPPYVHAANSGAVLNYAQAYLSLVRPGLILYGSYPDVKLKQKVDLRPVMRLESAITFLKGIPKGTSLGYGRSFISPSDLGIATVNIGYADGYPWRLSNKAFVLVHGKRAPVVGRVSMDQVLVDVTNISEVELGDKVVLIGRQNSEEITAQDLAEWAGTISYEILCGISRRVPRVYVEE
jgi:alanine racemase